MTRGAVLFYVQHLLGIGHLRRALRLVSAMAEEGLEVVLVSGGEPVPDLAALRGCRVVQLPPIRALNSGFRELVDAAGGPVDDALRAARRGALLDAFAAARPDAVVIEAFPFGRRSFRFELDPLIGAARKRPQPPLVASSIRDILVAPADPARLDRIVARVRADFDLVLVHGDPAFIALEESFPKAREIADRLVYTGYVAGPGAAFAAADDAGHDEVLVSAGGGAVGGALLRTAIQARRGGCLAQLRWRLLAGPNLPPTELAALASGLPAGVVLERYRADFPQMLRHCRVSVSQAGYNTVLDLLAARTAAVLVPFAADRESEQTLRAERLAARGLVEIVRERELSPEVLAQAIGRAVSRPRLPLALEIDGAGRSARLIVAAIRRRAAGADFRQFCVVAD